jgi:hypothetical protein
MKLSLPTNNHLQKKMKINLLNAGVFLFLTPLFIQNLPVKALPVNQPIQIAMNDCVGIISTTTNTYSINICVKPGKKGEMTLKNRKTGETFTLPARQVDEAGNVFSGSITKVEQINNKGFLPFLSRQTTTYVIDALKKEFSITKQTNLPVANRKTVQIEKLGAILMSSNQFSTIV